MDRSNGTWPFATLVKDLSYLVREPLDDNR